MDLPRDEQPSCADEMREEFKAAQRRRLSNRGFVFWRDTDLPGNLPAWPEPPPPGKLE